MIVAMNMASVARLGNPFRLSGFGDQVLRNEIADGGNEREDNDRGREEDNEHSYQIFYKHVDKPHTANEGDTPLKKTKIANCSRDPK